MANPLEKRSTTPYPHTLTLDNVWKGIVTGTSVARTPKETERIVSRIWQNPPLVPLSDEENQTLREYYMRIFIMDAPANDRYQSLAGPVVYFPETSKIPDVDRRTLLDQRIPLHRSDILVNEAAKKAMELGYASLTPTEKVTLFSTPISLHKTSICNIGTSSGSMTGWGISPFFLDSRDGSYGFTQQQFRNIAEGVSRRIGKNMLPILDVGGGNGWAMADILDKQRKGLLGKYIFQPTVSTAEEQLGMWPGSKYIIGPAERLPKYLKETEAIVVSNLAFRYFVYPDIALKNVVSALIPGGWMNVKFGFNYSPLRFYPDIGPDGLSIQNHLYHGPPLRDRVRSMYTWLHRMEEKGYIQRAKLRDVKTETIELIKLRSIPDKEFQYQ